MSNEKITKEELTEKLNEFELSDDVLDAIAGGKNRAAYNECYDSQPRFFQHQDKYEACRHLLH